MAEKRTSEFNQEQLDEAWQAFKGTLTPSDTDKLILSKRLEKIGAYELLIKLGSQLEVSFLDRLEMEMVQFLRNHLQNDHIVIKHEVAEIVETKKLYTSTDIYEYMIKQNPYLKDLKDRLGLDFEY